MDAETAVQLVDLQRDEAPPVNRCEIQVVGMSRSGNHAIIDWILSQASGRTCFLNCAEPKTNPFESARPISQSEGPARASYREFDLAAEQRGELTRKDLLIHSYEDTFLRAVADEAHRARRDLLLGSAGRRVQLLILRDPFNLFASRIASRIGTVPLHTAARIWSQHAREFLGLRRHLRDERVVVSYNQWVTSAAYRRRLATRLGLDHDDRALRHVPSAGGGSSFEGTALDGRAEQMNVLGRWRAFRASESYRQIFSPAVVELASEIFGIIPGTETMVAPALRELERAA